jgi:hypothetical protein
MVKTSPTKQQVAVSFASKVEKLVLRCATSVENRVLKTL